jgi:hypothetical protein
MSQSEAENNEKEYPSVELAYPIAVASYDIAVRRLDTMDGRLQTILAFIVTASAAVFAMAGGRGIPFRSVWFYGAVFLFTLSMGLGTYARLMGDVRSLSPANLLAEWLGDAPWTFKKDMIYNAARDFALNKELIYAKWRWSVYVTLIFCLEAVCLTVWIVASHP